MYKKSNQRHSSASNSISNRENLIPETTAQFSISAMTKIEEDELEQNDITAREG